MKALPLLESVDAGAGDVDVDVVAVESGGGGSGEREARMVRGTMQGRDVCERVWTGLCCDAGLGEERLIT